MTLTSNDCLITLVYFAFVLGIGLRLRSRMKTGRDFLLAGRALPAWLCGIAFLTAGLGAPEVIGMGAMGARYGLAAARFYWLGAIPAMLFCGLFLMPYYYGARAAAGARTVAEFLGLRFDSKTRTLNACLFAALAVFSSAVALYLMGRIIGALHVFDGLLRAMGWPLGGIVLLSVVVPALVVMAVVGLGGLRGAVYGQALQFLVLVAGLLPVVMLGLRSIGGWGGLKASLAATNPGLLHGSQNGGAGFEALGLGLILGASFWCSDFRVIQMAMAAKNVETARRAPILAAIPALLLPLLLILPGIVAIGLPTPRTTTTTRIENGAIYSEMTVVRPEAAAGNGLVPARMHAATGMPMLDASGRALLDYTMATPNLLLRALPNGLLGLGLTALLASLMSGLAANVTAFNTVFTYDVYQGLIRKDAGDEHSVAVGRWATVGALLVATGTACAALKLDHLPSVLLLAVVAVDVPLFVAVLLGVYWKRTTGHGAFAGLAAGAGAALLHYGLTLANGAHRGVQGGWMAVAHGYPSGMAQIFWTAVFALGAALLVTVTVSLRTKPRAKTETLGMVLKRDRGPWWKRPAAWAAAILLAAAGLALFVG